MSPCTSASPSRTASSAACSSSSMFERSHASSNTPSASVPSGFSRIGPQPLGLPGPAARRSRRSDPAAGSRGRHRGSRAPRRSTPRSRAAATIARQVLEHECGLGAVVVPAEERRQIVPSAQRLIVRPLDPQPVRGVVEGRDLCEGARAVGERHDPAAVRRCAVPPAGTISAGRLPTARRILFRVRLVHRRILAAAEGVTPPRRPGRARATAGRSGHWLAWCSRDAHLGGFAVARPRTTPACTRLRACMPVRCARARRGRFAALGGRPVDSEAPECTPDDQGPR